MKRQHSILAMVTLCFVLGACKRVDVIPESQITMLPLALGNEWVYVDSFIVTTSLPSTDTLVTAVRYEVTRQQEVDHYVKEGRTMERLHGWEVSNSYFPSSPLTMVGRADTLYTSYYYTFFYNADQGCNDITVNLLTNAALLYTYEGSLAPVTAGTVNEGDSLHFFPAFADLPDCIEGLGPDSVGAVNYQVFHRPSAYSSVLESVTTPAGTFTCVRFGTQLWAEGIGMIQMEQVGEAAYYDANYQLQTAQLRWKRSLNSYHIE
jgi:hypothetical protein